MSISSSSTGAKYGKITIPSMLFHRLVSWEVTWQPSSKNWWKVSAWIYPKLYLLVTPLEDSTLVRLVGPLEVKSKHSSLWILTLELQSRMENFYRYNIIDVAVGCRISNPDGVVGIIDKIVRIPYCHSALEEKHKNLDISLKFMGGWVNESAIFWMKQNFRQKNTVLFLYVVFLSYIYVVQCLSNFRPFPNNSTPSSQKK